jgi:hypothetical protein
MATDQISARFSMRYIERQRNAVIEWKRQCREGKPEECNL